MEYLIFILGLFLQYFIFESRLRKVKNYYTKELAERDLELKVINDYNKKLIEKKELKVVVPVPMDEFLPKGDKTYTKVPITSTSNLKDDSYKANKYL